MGFGSVMKAISLMSPPQFGYYRGNSSPTGVMSLAQVIREVSWERGVPPKSQQPPAACPPPASLPVAASLCLPTFPNTSVVPAGRRPPAPVCSGGGSRTSRSLRCLETGLVDLCLADA